MRKNEHIGWCGVCVAECMRKSEHIGLCGACVAECMRKSEHIGACGACVAECMRKSEHNRLCGCVRDGMYAKKRTHWGVWDGACVAECMRKSEHIGSCGACVGECMRKSKHNRLCGCVRGRMYAKKRTHCARLIVRPQIPQFGLPLQMLGKLHLEAVRVEDIEETYAGIRRDGTAGDRDSLLGQLVDRLFQ